MTHNEMRDRIVREVREGAVYALLPDEAQVAVNALPLNEIQEASSNVLIRPQPGLVSQGDRLLLNPCLAASWLMVFEHLNLPRSLRVYEPCAGSSEPVILAAEVYSGGSGEYVTVNLNRPLAAELKAKLGKVRMPVRIIEDDASRLDAPELQGTMDIACFHHAVNDILQTAVSEPRGMDTRTVDWWPNERQMIEWLGEDDHNGRLDDHARPALISAVRNAARLVKPGGYLLFDHWTWVAYETVEWFPWDLFQRLIPMAREWILESGHGLSEIPLPDRDPQWWMLYRKK